MTVLIYELANLESVLVGINDAFPRISGGEFPLL